MCTCVQCSTPSAHTQGPAVSLDSLWAPSNGFYLGYAPSAARNEFEKNEINFSLSFIFLAVKRNNLVFIFILDGRRHCLSVPWLCHSWERHTYYIRRFTFRQCLKRETWLCRHLKPLIFHFFPFFSFRPSFFFICVWASRSLPTCFHFQIWYDVSETTYPLLGWPATLMRPADTASVDRISSCKVYHCGQFHKRERKNKVDFPT